jgi:peptidoglycan L-alanyl-D-glutamate endopeptidase CwlK
MTLDPRSLKHLQGVRPELANVILEAANRTKFRITEGLRDQTRQAELVRSGKSKTQNSRHLTGHAIDLIAIGEDGIATYDMEDMTRVAAVIREVAKEQGVPIQWGAAAKYGGDFKTFNDSPHFQLPWKQYPAIGVSTTTRVVEAVSKPPVAVSGGAAVGTSAAVTVPSLPSLPAPPDLSAYTAWQSFGQQAGELMSWVSGNVVLTVACGSVIAFFTFLPKIKDKLSWARSSLSS